MFEVCFHPLPSQEMQAWEIMRDSNRVVIQDYSKMQEKIWNNTECEYLGSGALHDLLASDGLAKSVRRDRGGGGLLSGDLAPPVARGTGLEGS